jgi:hypothetical protein
MQFSVWGTYAFLRSNVALPIILLGITSETPKVIAQSPGTFTATGNMMTPRAGHTATLLRNGKVLIAGGYQSYSLEEPALASAELYDPSTGAFTPTGNMTGGIYDPATGAFSPTGDMVAQPYRGGKSAILLPDGRVFMAPGQATTLLQDGRVFIAGYPTAQLYDPITNRFAATAPYIGALPAVLQRATLLADGRVLLTGAVNICFQPLCRDPGTSWAELFDPASGAFAPAGSMKGHNNIYTATLLPNGKVLFAGGDTYNGVPPSAEVFDPSDGTFTAIEGASASHEHGVATLLPDGTVLTTGGFIPGGEAQVISELYIQASARFSAAGNMSAPRRNHTSTLLSDGNVLIAGGDSLGPSIASSAELYHPAVSVPSPFLFSLSGDGEGQGAIWDAATGQVASPDHRVTDGAVLSMYCTRLIEGGLIPPEVAIGGRRAEILFFGNAPGITGLNQVNFRVPSGVAAGPAVSVHLEYLGRPSNKVTIAVH